MPAPSPRIRKLAAIAAVVVAAVVVAAGGTVAGAAAASAPAAAHPTAQTYQTDHQLCYAAGATGPGIKLPPAGSVTLSNQFSTFKPVFHGGPFQHCNPVEKILSNQTFPITNPNAHLLCWKISGDTSKPQEEANNQFGSADLALGPADQLCLPSWKSLTKPPKMTPQQPPGLSHYTCYPVEQVLSGAYKAPGFKLQDEFAAHPVSARVISFKPTQLCEPTTKTVVTKTSIKVYPIVPGALQLLCFRVTQTPRRNPVFDQNQFTGPGVRIGIGSTLALCLPSTTGHLYWADNGNGTYTTGTIMRANPDGTSPVTLVTGQSFTEGLAVNSNAIYWANMTTAGSIMWAGLVGGNPATFEYPEYFPDGVAVDSSHVYWAVTAAGGIGSGTIMEANLTPGPATTLISGLTDPAWVAVDSTHIYWSESGSGSSATGTIWQANLNGTNPMTLVTGQFFPQGVAVDSSHLYWADPGDAQLQNGTIMKANLNGTHPIAIETGQASPAGVTVNGGYIYWANAGDGQADSGTIMRANLDGSDPTTLVTGQDVPTGIGLGPQ
jgi:sugar lactone lactonase YvrE